MHKSCEHIWCRLAKVNCELSFEEKKNSHETSLKQSTGHSIARMAQIKRHRHAL